MSSDRTARAESGWANWIGFAGAILLTNGSFSIVQGLIALVGPDTYFGVVDGDLVLFNVQGWGWWNLATGVLLFITGLAVLQGATWARIVGIILAIISMLVHMLLIPVQPWWSFIVIAIDLLIIYALVAHGDELRSRK